MGKRVSISQPTVIQTELRPLSESFWIDANGQLEQWYYQNTGVFSPDRQITALRLSPKLSLLDLDTNASYSSEASQEATEPPLHVSIQNVVWTVKEWNGSTWVETNISSVTAGDPYHTEGNDLIVSKNNYDAAHAINIKCRCNYADPRDIGTTCWLETTLMLVTNMDATQVYPTIDIKNPSARMFNPLKDDPIYEFEAEANWDVLEGQGGTDITEYKVDALGTEKILPANEDMLVNAAPLLDIKYGDTALAQQQFMDRQVSGGVISDIPDGLAKIDNIKGNTVKWNQLMQQNAAFTGNRCTVTSEGSVYTVSVSTDTSAGCGAYVGISVPNNHKFYASIVIKTNYSIRFGFTGNYASIPSNNNVYSRFSCILTHVDEASFIVYSNAQMPAGGSFSFYGINIIDLTAMGIDSLTTAQVESWLAANIGLKSYYPYTAGQLINYGGYSVKWNQIMAHGNFDSLEGWYNSQYVAISNNIATITPPNANTRISRTINMVSGHKYYFSAQNNTPTGTSFRLREGNNSGSAIASQAGSGSWSKLATIYTAVNTIESWMGFDVTTASTYQVKDILFIDLTLMFGAGNEPDLAWCDKYFSRDYYDYCAGIDKNILDVAEVKSAGFNKWDEEWEHGTINPNNGQTQDDSAFIRSKNYINVLPNTTYYEKASGKEIRIFAYDKSKTFITCFDKTDTTFVTPSNCYFIKFRPANTYGATYNHDICINISDPSKNGTYEPYKAQYEKLPMGVKTTGFNLWDEQWEVGSYYTSNGNKETNNSYYRNKNNIPCIPNTKYYFKKPTGVNGFILFYSKEYEYLGYNSFNSTVGGGVVTTPQNAYIANITVEQSSYGNDVCVNLSDTNRKDDQDVWGQQWVAGAYSASNGSFDDTVTTSLSSKGKIEVLPNRIYLLWLTSSKGGNRIVCFYDSSNNFISAQTLSAANSVTFTTPATAAYMTFTIVNYGSADYDYDNDIVLNLSKNGTYEAHWESFSDMSWLTKIGIENFNIWDEEWEQGSLNWTTGKPISEAGFIRSKNYIKVNPSTQYYFCARGIGVVVYQFDSSYNVIDILINVSSEGGAITSQNAAYIRFRSYSNNVYSYSNNICINKSIPTYNGNYLPHGQTMPYFPQGLCNVGNVYDEVKVENGKIKGVVRFKTIDLGDLGGWSRFLSGSIYLFDTEQLKYALGDIEVCNKYAAGWEGAWTEMPDDTIETKPGRVRFRDDSHSVVPSSSDNWVKGTLLTYALATPYEFEIDYPTKGQFEWYGIDGSGNEVPIDTLPVYSQAEQPSGYGQHSSRIRINALYGENIPVILRVKRYPWDNVVLPPKITKSVAWKMPPLDVIVTSNKGSAVRSQHLTTPTNFTFSAIVNQQGEVISDAKKQENLVFKWYYVKYGVDGQAATPVLAGQGLTIDVSTNTLKNSTPLQQGAVKQSTNVYCEVYLLGAYHLVNGTYVRSIE